MTEAKNTDFVRQIIETDIENKKNAGQVKTRFPPEPNGYLHIGHAKSICLNFGIAAQYDGTCNLRFDDTNPETEETEFVEAIKNDIEWLGFQWDGEIRYASDYFDQLYDWAVQLIKEGKAYVCDLSAEETKEYRGGYNKDGIDSPYRSRTPEENLDLFERMRAGEFDEGSRTLRAKIDMQSKNMNLRDPAMYRIRKKHHHRTGDKWCIYPTYDWTHGQSDSIESITHSICTLEFENHRPLYDWYIESVGIHHPQQIEFAKLVISYTMTSKRKLRELVEKGHVDGWDDPRLPTLSAFRRRGYTASSIRNFCTGLGVTKFNSMTELAVLERSIRDELNESALRKMVVIDPVKVVIENYPEGESEMRTVKDNPQDENAGTREVPFGRELYIEREDFMEVAEKGFKRLSIGGKEVRLKFGFFLQCHEAIKDDSGKIIELRCTYDPETSGGKAPDGRKPGATIHWVSAEHAIDGEVRLYSTLFKSEKAGTVPEGGDWKDDLNPESLSVLTDAKMEPSLADAKPGERFQFERKGYFCVDTKDSAEGKPVFNRIVTLKDAWGKKK